jgi:hypothetical protein
VTRALIPGTGAPARRASGAGGADDRPQARRHDAAWICPLAWLVDEASAASGPDRFLAELGRRLLADGLPLAGGALTLASPHPVIARRTWLGRGESGAASQALGLQ